jgi:preprotein translocase subunit SecG
VSRNGGAGVGTSPTVRPEGRWVALVKVTAWFGGLFLAIVFGMVSAYLVASAAWFGSRTWARLRRRALDEITGSG